MKPFLILQLRPEAEASDDEYQAILEKGALRADQTHRIDLAKTTLPADLDPGAYSGIIVGGGPGCVSDPVEKKSALEKRMEDAVLGLMPSITENDLPFMGCCYGIGILTHHLGGDVSKQNYGEPVGLTTCHVTKDGQSDAMLADCAPVFDAFVGHKEAAQALPPGCTHLLASDPCPFQMIRYKSNIYATQFHPEADAKGFEIRIRLYKDRGYFPPEDADRLIDLCRAADVTMPEKILRNFTARYG